MSGAEGAATRARFQTLYTKLVSLRQHQEAIRMGASTTDGMVRQQEVVERLCALVTVMRAERDFQLIDDLLAQAEDALCR